MAASKPATMIEDHLNLKKNETSTKTALTNFKKRDHKYRAIVLNQLSEENRVDFTALIFPENVKLMNDVGVDASVKKISKRRSRLTK
jgi:hypothetical protein